MVRKVTTFIVLLFLLHTGRVWSICSGSLKIAQAPKGCVGTPLILQNQSTGIDSIFVWKWGDGSANTITQNMTTHPSHTYSVAKNYNVWVIAYRKAAPKVCVDSIVVPLTVNLLPATPTFTFTPDNACSSSSKIAFTNTTGGSFISYDWTFGDGTSSNQQNPTHAYSSSGTGVANFNASLTVKNANGCANTAIKTVKVKQKPKSLLEDGNFSNFTKCNGDTFALEVDDYTINGGVIKYHIEWGDTTPDYDDVSPPLLLIHNYLNKGVYNLIYKVTGANGCVDSSGFKVNNISNPAVGAGFDLNTGEGCSPFNFKFQLNTFEKNPVSTIYTIDFGDSSKIDTFPHPPQINNIHNYIKSSCGQGLKDNGYTVTVTATNACRTSTATISPVVVFSKPLANYDSTGGCVGEPLSFINKTVLGNNVNCGRQTVFTWTWGDGTAKQVFAKPVTDPAEANGTHTFSNPGVYNVDLFAEGKPNTCKSDTKTRQVCILPIPKASFSSPQKTGCAPFTVQFTNSSNTIGACAKVNYKWSNAIAGTSCNGASPIIKYENSTSDTSVNPKITFQTPGTYVLSLIVSTKCLKDTVTDTIFVKGPPTVSLTSIPSQCGTAALNPTATYTTCLTPITSYQWTLTGGTPASSTTDIPGLINYNSLGTYDVKVKATNLCGADSATRSFTINPVPTVNATVNKPYICLGDTAILAGSGNAVSYSWAPTTALTSPNKDTTKANPKITTTYTVTGKSAAGCPKTATAIVNVKPLPVLTLTKTKVICKDSTTTLTVSGASTYSWAPSVGLDKTIGTNVKATPLVTTEYYVTGTDNDGCKKIDTSIVTVNPHPDVTVNPNSSICKGDSIVLTASGADNGYTWKPMSGLTSSTLPSIKASPASTTTYVVTGNNTFNCIDTAMVKITVNTLPVLTASNDTIICNGSPATLKATAAGSTFEWLPTTTLSASSGPIVFATPSDSTTYTVTATNANGCKKSEDVVVKVIPVPLAITGPDSTICNGKSIQIGAPALPGNSYAWTSFPGGFNSISSNPLITPNDTTTYYLTETNNATQCKRTDSVNVIVNPIPAVVITPASTSICSETSTSIALTSVVPNTAFNWTVVADAGITGIKDSTASNIKQTLVNSLQIDQSAKYTITPVANNCFGSPKDVSITVRPLPTIAISDASPTICEEDTTTISVSGSSVSYTWSPISDLNVNTGATVKAFPSTTTTYTATGTGANGCKKSINSVLNVNPLPVVTATPSSQSICSGTTTLIALASTIDPGTTYTWTVTAPASITGASAGFGDTISQVLSSNSNIDQNVTYKITPEAAGCDGHPINVTITVHPKPILTISSATPTICSEDTTDIDLKSNVAGSTFSWTVAITDSISGATASSGDSVGQKLINESVNIQKATYTITPLANGCNGDSKIAVVTVNPTPVFTVISPALCSGASTNIPLYSKVTGTTFTWTTSVNANVTGNTDGNGNLISQLLSTASKSPQTITYAITSKANNCPSPVVTSTVTVNPIPVATATVTPQIICSGEPAIVDLTSDVAGTTFKWTASGPATIFGAHDSSGVQINDSLFNSAGANGTVNYSITPTANNCPGTPITATITVKPLPNISVTPTDSTICEGDNVILKVSGNSISYQWSPAASLSSSTATQVTAKPPVTTIYTVIGTGANGCTNGATSKITVNQLPVLTVTPASQTICSKTAISIALSSTINPGTTYTWTSVVDDSLKVIAGLTTDTITDFITNTDTIDHKIIYTVTPWVGVCDGPAKQVTIIVHPEPIINADSTSLTICSEGLALVNLSSFVSNTTFSWTTVSSGNVNGFNDGSGNKISQTLTNTSFNIENVTYTITARANSCNGPQVVIPVTVNPTPVFTVISPSICSGSNPKIPLASQVANTTFSWTASVNPNITGAANGTGDTISNVLNTIAVVAETIDYTIISKANNCPSKPVVSKVTINPVPLVLVSPATQTICSKDTALISISSDVAGTTFNWIAAPEAGLTGASDGSGDTIQQALYNTGNSPKKVIYSITPATNSCSGFALKVPVIVNHLLPVNAGTDKVICINEGYEIFTGFSPDSGLWSGTGIIDTSGIFDPVLSGTGSYSLIYRIIDPVTKCPNRDTLNVIVNPKPIAAFTPQPLACKDVAVNFKNNSTGAAIYHWDFGDGSDIVAFEPQHSYSDTGGATVTMIATSADNCKDTTSSFTKINTIPYLNVSLDTHKGCGPLKVVFTNSTIGYSPVYAWNFGNGITSTNADPGLITFAGGNKADTTYYINVSATNHCGTKSFNDSVLVFSIPIANFAFSQDTGCSPLKVFIANRTTGSPLTFEWDLDNGKTDSGFEPPSQIYTTGKSDSTYYVQLISSNKCGSDTIVKPLLIKPNTVEAFFTVNNDRGCEPLNINFTNWSKGHTSYSWDFGDGATSLKKSPNHSFPAGSYTAILYITNGCSFDTAQINLTSYPLPDVKFAIANDKICDGDSIKITNNTPAGSVFEWDFGNGITSAVTHPKYQYPLPGNYNIKLTAQTIQDGCIDSLIKPVTIYDVPKADFTVSDTIHCQPVTITFGNTSVGGSTYLWDFGDGITSSTTQPYSYINAGTYLVKLLALNASGCPDTAKKEIIVLPRPKAEFKSDLVSKCVYPTIVQFTNQSQGETSWNWSFDGLTTGSTISSPKQAYDTGGTYATQLIIRNNVNCYDTITHPVVIPKYAEAQIGVAKDRVCLGNQITFINKSTNTTTSIWDFNDGNTISNYPATHKYNKAGTYLASFIADNDANCPDTARQLIIIDPKPIANFYTSDSINCYLPFKVNFTNVSLGAFGYSWDFGNGLKSIDNNPTTNYIKEGTHKATLIAANTFGCKDTISKPITVYSPPTASFKLSSSDNCVPATKVFINNSTTAQKYQWFFGDDFTSLEREATHIYRKEGKYKVMLLVSDTNGFCSDTALSDEIQIYPKPTSNFSWSDHNEEPARGNMYFTNLSTFPANYQWDFNGEGSSSEENPHHQFFNFGKQAAQLITTNEFNCSDTSTKMIDVRFFKSLFIPNAFSPESGTDEVRLFTPKGRNLREYRIQIYNTWGTLIWESTALKDGSPAESWDGYYQNVLCAQDVYVWKVEATFLEGSIWQGKEYETVYKNTGTVTLIK